MKKVRKIKVQEFEIEIISNNYGEYISLTDMIRAKDGNVRDYADVTQLVCLANLESINAEFIKMGLLQKERLIKLNETAITQMGLLLENKNVAKLLK